VTVMKERQELERMLKSGKGIKITAIFILITGLILGFVLCREELWIGICFFIILLVFALVLFLCGLNISSNKRKTLDRLEMNNDIKAAIDDYHMENTVKLDQKGYSAFGKKFLFALASGRIYRYDEILWVYIVINRQNGIPLSQVLCVGANDGRKTAVVSERVDQNGTDKLTSYIAAIVKRNPECLSGSSPENARLYRKMVKAYKNTQ